LPRCASGESGHIITEHIEEPQLVATFECCIDGRDEDGPVVVATNLALSDPTSTEGKALTAKTQVLFQGETLRGLLLTSYGFSIFGDRAQTVAYVCYGLAFVLLLAAIAGFIHAGTKSAQRQILPKASSDEPATA
jgi:hypothetical protein